MGKYLYDYNQSLKFEEWKLLQFKIWYWFLLRKMEAVEVNLRMLRFMSLQNVLLIVIYQIIPVNKGIFIGHFFCKALRKYQIAGWCVLVPFTFGFRFLRQLFSDTNFVLVQMRFDKKRDTWFIVAHLCRHRYLYVSYFYLYKSERVWLAKTRLT